MAFFLLPVKDMFPYRGLIPNLNAACSSWRNWRSSFLPRWITANNDNLVLSHCECAWALSAILIVKLIICQSFKFILVIAELRHYRIQGLWSLCSSQLIKDINFCRSAISRTSVRVSWKTVLMMTNGIIRSLSHNSKNKLMNDRLNYLLRYFSLPTYELNDRNALDIFWQFQEDVIMHSLWDISLRNIYPSL